MVQPFDPLKHQNSMLKKIEGSLRWNITQTNISDFELCKNLMLLDTVALTATIIVLSNSKIVDDLSTGAIILLIINTACVVFSIFFGIANYVIMINFQRKWSKINTSIAEKISAKPLSPAQISQTILVEQSNVPVRANPWCLYVQIAFISVALLLYLTIIIVLLANNL